MKSTNDLTVVARRWAHGWELILGDRDATQVRSLAHADRQVRDYLDTVEPHVDHSDVAIRLVPEVGGEAIERARQARKEAQHAEAIAAEKIRDVVIDFRQRKGYSLTDTAALLGVTRARISQLERGSKQSAVS